MNSTLVKKPIIVWTNCPTKQCISVKMKSCKKKTHWPAPLSDTHWIVIGILVAVIVFVLPGTYFVKRANRARAERKRVKRLTDDWEVFHFISFFSHSCRGQLQRFGRNLEETSKKKIVNRLKKKSFLRFMYQSEKSYLFMLSKLLTRYFLKG